MFVHDQIWFALGSGSPPLNVRITRTGRTGTNQMGCFARFARWLPPDEAEANCERYMATNVSAKQKSSRARGAASLTLFAQWLEQSSRAAGQLGSAELAS